MFTHYFLTDGITATAEWQASRSQPEVFAAFRDGVQQRYDALRSLFKTPFLLGMGRCRLPRQGAQRMGRQLKTNL